MPKGKKICTSCAAECGVRTKVCVCGQAFQFNPPKHPSLRRKKGKPVQWETLEKGDVIRCMQGSGPYWLSKDRPGEKIMLGEKGRFEVVELYNTGPRSCGIMGRKIYTRGARAGVREFIYMGESWYNDDLCNHNEPHKIVLLEKKNDE